MIFLKEQVVIRSSLGGGHAGIALAAGDVDFLVRGVGIGAVVIGDAMGSDAVSYKDAAIEILAGDAVGDGASRVVDAVLSILAGGAVGDGASRGVDAGASIVVGGAVGDAA